jgi:hypothetical protein
VDDFLPAPELQTAPWLPRLALAEVLRYETWDGPPGAAWAEVRRAAEGP